MNPLKTRGAGGRFPSQAPRLQRTLYAPPGAICTSRLGNLYTGAGGITLWHVIRSRGPVAAPVFVVPARPVPVCP
jgi:hypothetical protein